MLDIYICEDSPEQLAFAKTTISDYCIMRNLDAAVVLASSNPTEIIAHYKSTQNPSLFFLDIDLKSDINGIELASHIREESSKKKTFIVFLTTHTEMTLLTFQYKVEALDFIPKDNHENIKRRIGECIDIAISRHIDTTDSKGKTLQISVDDKIIILDSDEIISIETTHIRHKLRLYTHTRTLEFNAELKHIETQLDSRFIRCHKSYIAIQLFIKRNQNV